jgi:replication initiation and membrane attachment protein DnaB
MRRLWLLAGVPMLLCVSVAGAQHPLLDMAANKVIQKYQQSTCEQLWEQKGKPKTAQEQEIIQFLRNDPQMRAEFINRIAGPVANKMFECGMIP